MSKSPNNVDSLYKNWCNMSKGGNEDVEDYAARAVQFKNHLHGTENELQLSEFVRKWREGFGKIFALIN